MDNENFKDMKETMKNISKAMELANEKENTIKEKENELREEIRPVIVEEKKVEIEKLKEDKKEFDEMTVNALVRMKEDILRGRKELQANYQKELLAYMDKKKSIEDKLVKMKKRADTEEKLEKVEQSANHALYKASVDMKNFQDKYNENMSNLDEWEKDISDYALKLDAIEKIDHVSIKDIQESKKEIPVEKKEDVKDIKQPIDKKTKESETSVINESKQEEEKVKDEIPAKSEEFFANLKRKTNANMHNTYDEVDKELAGVDLPINDKVDNRLEQEEVESETVESEADNKDTTTKKKGIIKRIFEAIKNKISSIINKIKSGFMKKIEKPEIPEALGEGGKQETETEQKQDKSWYLSPKEQEEVESETSKLIEQHKEEMAVKGITENEKESSDKSGQDKSDGEEPCD